MTDTKLIAAIDSYANQAYGSDADGGELSTQRSLALDAYEGKNIEPAPEGRSQVVDRSIFETIQWILPALVRIFASGDNIVEFEPEEEGDEQAAEQESDYLNYLITQRNNWFLTFLTWAQDALLTKNAYCLAHMEEKKEVETNRYEGQSEDQVAMLLDDDVEVVASDKHIDESQKGPILDPSGMPVMDPATAQMLETAYQEQGVEPQYAPVYVYDLEIKRVKPRKRLRLRVLPPERCKIGEDTPDFTLEECNYFEFDDLTTISDLRKEGYDVSDDIAEGDYVETQEDFSRDETYNADRTIDIPDPAMRQVTCRYIWIRHDYDEDGIAELQYVVRVGREILKREEVSRIPVACIVPLVNTHRHIGVSIADLVFEIQRIKTAILRTGLDSLYLSVRPRHVVSNEVDLNDMMVPTVGGTVRMKEGSNAIPGQGHVMPLETQFVFPEAQAGLQHMDMVIESRAGVSKQFQGIDPSANNDYNRIGQLSTMASQRVELIARIMANGVERLFALAHELIIKSGHQSESIKLRGTWVNINPTQWRTGRDMRVVAPFAAGNKDSLLQRLLLIKDIHAQALQGGLSIVDEKNAYNLALEIAKAADVAGRKFFTDPDSVQPPPPPPDYTGMAIQVENKKADNEAADEQRKATLEEQKIELERYKAELDAQVKQYQSDTNSQTQIALAQIKSGDQVSLEKLKANLKANPIEVNGSRMNISDAFTAVQEANQKMAATLDEAVGKLAEALAATNRPKRVVRDDRGRVTGVEPA